jgi:ankyrin repeat protein/protein-tyrosine phosphatase
MSRKLRSNSSSRLGEIGRKVHNLKLYDNLSPLSPPIISDDLVLLVNGLSDDLTAVRKAVEQTHGAPFSLLHVAVLRHDVSAIQKLLHVVDVNTLDSSRWTPLHWASAFCEGRRVVEVMDLLLKQPKVEVDALDGRGLTPLIVAVDKLNENAVYALLNAGADPNVFTTSGANSILIAAYHCSYRIAELLVGGGANLEVEGEDGMSPLMIAVKQDNMDMIVFLVKMGARVDFATKIGTASLFAVSAVVKQFLQDSSYFQTHEKEKKQLMYARMVETSRHAMRLSNNSPSQSMSSSMLSLPTHGDMGAVSVASSTSDLTLHPPSPNPPPKLAAASGAPPAMTASDQRKIYTSENFPLDLEFFTHPLLGSAQIGMSMCPGRNKPKPRHVWKRDLNTDLRVIKDAGVEILVVLVRSIELLSMGIMEMFVRAEQLGLKTLHFPVQDKWVPESMSEVVELVEKLVGFVKEGRKISIFCNGGKGRTGMVVVATMVALGMSVDDAIVEIRRRRSGMIRNPAQIIYLRWFGEKKKERMIVLECLF